MANQLLSITEFKWVVHRTTLISLDFVVKNTKNQVLLGKRGSAPAKGYWFVPGGRVLKNEPIIDAFSRLLKCELSIFDKKMTVKFLGLFEYFIQVLALIKE